MDQLISHSGDLFPGNGWMLLRKSFRKLFDSLSDDLQFADNRAQGLVILDKGVITHAAGEGFNPFNRQQDILYEK